MTLKLKKMKGILYKAKVIEHSVKIKYILMNILGEIHNDMSQNLNTNRIQLH